MKTELLDILWVKFFCKAKAIGWAKCDLDDHLSHDLKVDLRQWEIFPNGALSKDL
jgi:hypothetical protein